MSSKRRSLTLAVPLLLFAVAAPLQAQTGVLMGRVTSTDGDMAVGTALVEAVVDAGRPMAQTTTDANGRYRLAGLQPGRYTVVVTAVGFRTNRATDVTVQAGATATANVILEAAAFELDAVVVSASRQVEKATEAPASLSVIPEREIREQPSITMVDHLRSTPGVDIITTGVQSRNVVARGFNNIFSGALHTLTDYRIASVPSLRVNFLQFIPQSDEDVGRMEVVLGPGSALYGPNTANGVLHILTKSPLEESNTVVSLAGGEQDLWHGNFRTSQRLSDRFGFKVSGQYATATEWNYRDAGEDSVRAIIGTPAAGALFPPTMPQAERERRSALIAARDFDIRRWSGDVRADWRATDDITAVFSAGMTNNNSIELTGIGAGQAVDWKYSYAQTRLTYRDWFAQAYFNLSDAGDTYLLRNGAPITDKSRVFVSQIQHRASLGRRQRFAYGMDFVRTTPITEGTINGRNEDDDQYTEIGAYLQSQTELHPMFDLVLAGRVDDHSELPDPVFSPRAALLFKPHESHTLRATFNRSFSTPTSLNLFLDIDAGPLGALGPFGFRAHAQAPGRAGINLHAPDGSLQMRTPFAGDGDGVTLRSITAGSVYDNQIRALGLANPAVTADLRLYLMSLKADPAFGAIPLILLDPLTSSATPFSNDAVNDIPGIKESTTSTVEFGYKGLIANRLLLAADVWWSRQKNFTSPLITATPLVLMAPQQLAQFVVPRLVPVFMAQGMDQGTATTTATAIATGLAQLPGGIIASADVSAGGPALALTYINFGEVDLSGVDVAATAILSDQFQLGVTGSLVSDDYFNLPLGNGDSTVVALNAPRKKASTSLTYRNLDQGFNAQVRLRWTDEFPANSAGYVGLNCVDSSLAGDCVKSYTLVDLTAGYQLPFTGASLQLSVSNLFDEAYQSFIGVPTTGRMAILRMRYQF
ncbi:MAG TPA: TonB-dependent receptor [Longimicrobiales bacterium]|nr:TonB-dependent receptor [Longimicrobiales bacterium]